MLSFAGPTNSIANGLRADGFFDACRTLVISEGEEAAAMPDVLIREAKETNKEQAWLYLSVANTEILTATRFTKNAHFNRVG